MNPRKIERIVVHTAATPEGRDIGAQEIDRWHRQRGWRMIGYHYVIRLDGTVEEGRDETIPGAHARGYNRTSIGICLIGGMDASNSGCRGAGSPRPPWRPQSLPVLRREALVGCGRGCPRSRIGCTNAPMRSPPLAPAGGGFLRFNALDSRERN
jgi:hypothetical protein